MTVGVGDTCDKLGTYVENYNKHSAVVLLVFMRDADMHSAY